MAADNNMLGNFSGRHPARPRGVPQVEVTGDIDADGILKVSSALRPTKPLAAHYHHRPPPLE